MSRAGKLASTTALVGVLLCFAEAKAIEINGTFDASTLADELFLDSDGLTVTSATLSHGEAGGEAGYGGYGGDGGEFEVLTLPPPVGIQPSSPQSGTYTNSAGTYGLPAPGIGLSSGFIQNYETGPNTDDSFTGGDGLVATPDQNDLLDDLSGLSDHFDPVQLDIEFDVGPDVSNVSFVGVFGSEEFPEFVDTAFNDAFGLFLNGTNIAGVQPSGAAPGDPLLPVNIDHPDMQNVPGTELDGILAPDGVPLLRFDAPVEPNSTGNVFSIIVADASDSGLDTTVFLSSFGNFEENDGSSEFTPLLPDNPPDPETGVFEFELPEIQEGETIWIDPPVSVGFEYNVTNAFFDTITAPSLLTVNDPDGYTITVDGSTFKLSPGSLLDFGGLPGISNVDEFTLTGIDPNLGLDPNDPLAFPLGVSLVDITSPATVFMDPITEVQDVPAPRTAWLMLAGLLGLMLVFARPGVGRLWPQRPPS